MPLGPTPAVSTARVPLLRRLVRNPTGVVALVWLVLIVLAAVLAPLLAPHDPATASARDVLAPPGGAYPLGADSSGRDILSRLLFASRVSLTGAATTVVVAAALGISAGLIAGYHGRRFESVASWVASLIMSLNAVVVLLAVRSVLGPSMVGAMAVFGVLIAPAFYRVVAAAVSGVRHELYVDAARVAGLSDSRIIARHVLTVVRAPAIILAAGIAGIAIAISAGLDFLGLGDPGRPSWGGMLNAAFGVIYRAPLQLLWPSAAIGLTCIALVLLGNALRDELERSAGPAPRRRRGRTAAAVTVATEPVVVHEEPVGARGGDLLRIQSLSVGYDQPDGSVTTVVRDVSFTVRRGEVHGLIGESGSGKTQTAWSILRLLPPGGRIVGGTIEFEDADLASASNRQMTALRGAKIAYVPQEPMSNLDPAFTIGHQLTEPLRLTLGIGAAEARERALALLTRVGIPDPPRTYAAYPHQISGGMAQRVLIAGAVSCNPDLLIADEPTTALDVTVQAEVLDLLRDLRAEFDMGVLLVTHDLGVVADLCDRVSVMRAGRIVETGPTRSLFADPRHEYTRALFDAVLEDGPARGPLIDTDPTTTADTATATQGARP
ncbi:ATP-binding cassette domain-containing protein [Modestobacter sp. I12A-02628]|uniref:Dipeptide/oligopeptide/nickel ABC transporter permease/ATP-binding protein n=1 Tax=Goekera deserti TaxID=2497753 RepID=A0A7K3WHX2_9ACTN|nr:ATP-binding cassette domain-containing protein [Goekera deserti]NDI47103.1 ATP-binding cassette domain-containing protein [Goekera deserti]NEL55499.1 dipeptide/oligopeptide/nickel ABC transporter permease/ATP-binding protein [Goekera deserti]